MLDYTQVVTLGVNSLRGCGVNVDMDQPKICLEADLVDLTRTYFGEEDACEVMRQLVIADVMQEGGV